MKIILFLLMTPMFFCKLLSMENRVLTIFIANGKGGRLFEHNLNENTRIRALEVLVEAVSWPSFILAQQLKNIPFWLENADINKILVLNKRKGNERQVTLLDIVILRINMEKNLQEKEALIKFKKELMQKGAERFKFLGSKC